METMEDTRVDQLVHRLNRANSISDFTLLIGDLAKIEAVGDAAEKIGDLRRAAFGGLRRLNYRRFVQVAFVIDVKFPELVLKLEDLILRELRIFSLQL